MEYVKAKTILTRAKNSGAWFGMDYNMNLYKGCCHGCIYCDSRSECYGIEAYKQSLKTYLQYLEIEKSIVNEQVTFDVFSRDNIKDYVSWLKGKSYVPKTINLKLTAIRSFLKYCSEEDFEL